MLTAGLRGFEPELFRSTSTAYSVLPGFSSPWEMHRKLADNTELLRFLHMQGRNWKKKGKADRGGSSLGARWVRDALWG